MPEPTLFDLVEGDIAEIAHRALKRFESEIPVYGMLPREQLDGEILQVTTGALRLFFAALRSNESISEEDLCELRRSAARRAEERVPLDSLLSAYHLGGQIGWEALVDGARVDDRDTLIVAAGQVLSFVHQVTGAVAAAYLEERQSIYGEERDALQAVAAALLAGEPADRLAARAGVTVAPAYVVLEMRIAEHPDERNEGVSGAVAARRKLRRIHSRLERWAGQPILGSLEPAGGSALIATSPEEADSVLPGLPDLIADLNDAAQAEVIAGIAVASTTSELPSALRQAREVLALAEELGRGPGAYSLVDVLLEYQLSRPSDALLALGQLLDPLERNPDLLATLETYLQHDLVRRDTARKLHVHPNTLDYRLRRVVALTGIDPSTSRGLQLVGAAFAARRLHPDS